MKNFLCLIVFLFIIQNAYAGIDTFETKDQYRDRQNYNNYQTYQKNNYQAPLGGYGSNSLNHNNGDKYGYNTSYPNMNNNNYHNGYNNNGYNANYNRF